MSFCHDCGEALVQGWAFCQGCGSALTVPEPAIAGAQRRTQPPIASAQSTNETVDGPAEPAEPSATEPAAIADQPSEDPSPIEEMLGTEWGGELSTNVVKDPSPAPVTSKTRLSRRQVLTVLAAFAAFAVFAVTTLHIIGTHDRLNRTRNVLATTRADLDDTRS